MGFRFVVTLIARPSFEFQRVFIIGEVGLQKRGLRMHREVGPQVAGVVAGFGHLVPGFGVLVLRAALVSNDAAHAGGHVVEGVAVEKPVLLGVGRKLDGDDAHRRDVERVFHGRVGALGVHQAKHVPVQVHGVAHHGQVLQHHAHVLALADRNSIGHGQGLVVERPDVAQHIAGQRELDFAPLVG